MRRNLKVSSNYDWFEEPAALLFLDLLKKVSNSEEVRQDFEDEKISIRKSSNPKLCI